jgi:hypothetical protein
MVRIIRKKGRKEEEKTHKVFNRMSPGNKKRPHKLVCPFFGLGSCEMSIFDRKIQKPKTDSKLKNMMNYSDFFESLPNRLIPYKLIIINKIINKRKHSFLSADISLIR